MCCSSKHQMGERKVWRCSVQHRWTSFGL